MPSAVTIMYDQSSQALSASTYTIQPKNSASTQTFNWTVSKSGDNSWLTLNPTSGTSPNGNFTAAANKNDSAFGVLGDHAGSLAIHASSTNAECPASDDTTIPTHLVVVQKMYRTYIPAVTRN
jgi:hypothetical protein